MSRVDALIDSFEPHGVEALIVSAPTNIRYLSGFTGSSGTLVVGADGALLFTDSRYTERAEEEIGASGADVRVVTAPRAGRAELIAALAEVSHIGVEAEQVSWAEATSLVADLGDDRVVSTRGLVEALREIKDDGEVDLMRTAASIADGALEQLLQSFAPGPSEREVARRLDELVLDGGADAGAFETIVATGPNASRPHHQAGDRRLAAGDLVIIDFGAEYHGYRSDMTRSFVLGTPNARQHEVLEAVKQAQQAGVDAVASGVDAAAIDRTCREHLVASGFGEWFTHGTGHGVGLDIHEAPSVSAKGTATLAAGHVITVEPGVYIPAYGGVRWEDTVVVTEDGAEPLTRSPKHPVVG